MRAGGGDDVLIVGAGPAGLAVAMAATLRGMRVRVVDVARAPTDKACGEGLLPDAMACLGGLGVSLRAGRAIRGICFEDGGRVAEARFAGECGRGVRRRALHEAMLERAGALGIEVEWGTVLRGLEGQGQRFIVGADGGQSRVRAWAGLNGVENGGVPLRRIGLRQHFAVRPWSDCVIVTWGAGVQAYVTPVGEEEVGVAFVARQRFAGMGEALLRFPALRERLGQAATTSTPRGAATGMRRLRRVTAGNRLALVGDASGSVDAITGEGLNLCFRQAEALADAMSAGRLDGYEAAHRRILRVPRGMSAALLAMDGSPRVREAAMLGLSRWPRLFEALLRMHAAGGRKESPRGPGVVPCRRVD